MKVIPRAATAATYGCVLLKLRHLGHLGLQSLDRGFCVVCPGNSDDVNDFTRDRCMPALIRQGTYECLIVQCADDCSASLLGDKAAV